MGRGGQGEKRELQELPSRACLSVPSVSSLGPPSYSVSPPIRNRIQQRENVEGDPALLAHDAAEFRDGEEEHRGPRSRGSALPGGGAAENQRWVILCSVTLTLAVFSLSPVMPLATFRGSHIFPMGGGCQSSDVGGRGWCEAQPARGAYVYL